MSGLQNQLSSRGVWSRVETSHWSRSAEILCYDWLSSYCCYELNSAIKKQSRHPKLPTRTFLALSCVFMVASMHRKDLL